MGLLGWADEDVDAQTRVDAEPIAGRVGAGPLAGRVGAGPYASLEGRDSFARSTISWQRL